MVRTRFAPSPTGYLHIGGLRTALYAYLYAKQHGGKFLLRIEDTDRERFVADGTANILKSLYWAGLAPDEGVVCGRHPEFISGSQGMLKQVQHDKCEITQIGEYGPYIQSQRLAIYQKYAQELLDKGHAYYCFCSAERLAQLREKQQANKQPTGYDGLCAQIDPVEAQKRAQAGENHVIRMKMPKTGETVFKDLIRGEIKIKNELVDDQVLIKSDGYPTYHLAVVVDDHLMKISHVIRGEEWISSTPKHLQLYKYFGWEAPQFAHLPLLLNTDKTKLSKRQGDVAVEDYAKKGYLPEAIINFVAFLGWNPGGQRELFTLDELIKEFDLSKVGKAGAVFNLEKLDWYNQQYIRALSSAKLADRALPFFTLNKTINKEQLTKAIDLEKARVVMLSELPEAVKFVFELPKYKPELLVWKKSDLANAKKILKELAEFLDNEVKEKKWNKENLEKEIMKWIGERRYGNGDVLWPLRVALSGQENSPGPFEIAAVLGKTESLKRINFAVGE